MAKFSIAAAPTFQAPVEIQLHGGGKAVIAFTFRHRRRSEIDGFVKGLEGKAPAAVVEEMASGWDLEDEFTSTNIAELLDNFGGAYDAISTRYFREIAQAPLGN